MLKTELHIEVEHLEVDNYLVYLDIVEDHKIVKRQLLATLYSHKLALQFVNFIQISQLTSESIQEESKELMSSVSVNLSSDDDYATITDEFGVEHKLSFEDFLELVKEPHDLDDDLYWDFFED